MYHENISIYPLYDNIGTYLIYKEVYMTYIKHRYIFLNHKIKNFHKVKNFQELKTFKALKPLIVWVTTNCGKFFERDGNIKAPYLPPEKPVCRSRSNS